MQNKQYKYLTLIAMISAIILPCAAITFNKVVIINGSTACAGTILMPFWFIISDIVTEVYGYKVSRQIFWYSLLCNFLFAIFTIALVNLPSSKSWVGEQAYSFVFGNILPIVFGSFFAAMVGTFLNTYLISKWKILVNGKYFWLRSIGASTIGEFIYTMVAFLLIFRGTLEFKQISTYIMWSYSFKIVGAVILIIPANIIVKFLKNKEHIDVYDTNVNFNPFKLSTE